MINKTNMWFLTLSSIILVLSIYYIGGSPTNTDMVFSSNTDDAEIIVLEENEALTAMRVTKEEADMEEMQVLQEVLLNAKSSVDDKNDAYEKIKLLNNEKSIEEKLEDKINKEFKVSSFVEIDKDKIKVVIANKDDSYELANKIINMVSKNVDGYYYVTVKFE